MGFGDDVPFALRVAETIAWCEARAVASDPAGSLRSEALRPKILEVDRSTIVRRVAAIRAMQRDVRKARPDPLDLIPPGGRLLVYFPDEDLSDGAAEAESGGFFDVNNTPPWDTWIALIRHDSGDPSAGDILFSWVPEPFVRRADRGIGANPEGCIEWLAQSGLPIAARIRAGVAFR